MYGKSGKAERFLGLLEGETARVIREVVTNENVPAPFTHELRFLNLFVMLQWSRTPAAVDRQHKAHTQLMQQMMKTHPKYSPDLKAFVESVQTRFPNALGEGMKFALRSFPLLQDLRLKVIRNVTPLEFIVGDAPAVMHNQWCRSLTVGSTGLACGGLQIFMPLSPNHLAVFYDTDVYDVGASAAADIVDAADPADVMSLNSLQYAAARDCVYYRTAEMATHIDALPVSAREDPLGVRAERFKEDGGSSYLLVVQNFPMNVDIRTKVIRIRPEARLASKRDRANALRPEAVQMAEKLFPESKEQRDRPGPRPGTAFGPVDD